MGRTCLLSRLLATLIVKKVLAVVICRARAQFPAVLDIARTPLAGRADSATSALARSQLSLHHRRKPSRPPDATHSQVAR
jgi:hypothetical protein